MTDQNPPPPRPGSEPPADNPWVIGPPQGQQPPGPQQGGPPQSSAPQYEPQATQTFQPGPPAGYTAGPPQYNPGAPQGGHPGPPQGYPQGPPGYGPPPGYNPGAPQGFNRPPEPPKSNALRNVLLAVGALVILGGGAFAAISLFGGDDDVQPVALADVEPTDSAGGQDAAEDGQPTPTDPVTQTDPATAATNDPVPDVPIATTDQPDQPQTGDDDAMSGDGEVVPGQVPSADGEDEITLELLSGEHITLDAESTDFDPIITLLDPTGAEVARDDDGGDGFSALVDYTVPETGTYVAVVSSFGAGTGDFELTLRFPDGEFAVDETFDDTGTIVDADAVQTFNTDLLVDEQITVSVVASPGSDLDPRVRIIGPDGAEVGVDDDGGDEFNSLLTITAVETGQYVTEVDSFGSTTGDFLITITVQTP